MCSKPGVFNPYSMCPSDRIGGRKVTSLKALPCWLLQPKQLLPVLHIEVLTFSLNKGFYLIVK